EAIHMTTPTRGTILIADDESYVTAVVGLKLREAGYDVIVAGDGEEAYQQACSNAPLSLNMIVTDLQMPKISGLELGRLLKANPLSARELVRKVEEMATSTLKARAA